MKTSSFVPTWVRSLSPRSATITILCVWAALVASALLWPGELPLQGKFIEWAKGDAGVLSGAVVLSVREAGIALRFAVILCASLAAFASLAFLFRRKLFTPARVSTIFYWTVTFGCCWTLFVCLSKHGYEGSWLPLHQVMYHPKTLPVFGRRLLMVWVARGAQAVVPSLSDLRAFYVASGIAIFLAIYSTGIWAAKVIGAQWRIVAQVLLVAILSPTFDYFTFYDVAIIFFFTIGLLFLYQRRYGLFVLTVTVGTLNHENILLLILVAAFILWKREPWRRNLAVPLAALAGYVGVRIALLLALPSGQVFDLRIYSNLVHLYEYHRIILVSAATLLPWWICALCGFFVANVFLRRAALLLPLLAGVTYVFGQFHEARQYDAFIPVVIALILSFLSKGVESGYFKKTPGATEESPA